MEDNYNKNDLDTDINIEEIKQHLNNLDENQEYNHDNDNNDESNDEENVEDEEKIEKKEIEVITGDGNLDISPVYDHIDIEKPDEKGKKQIIIPEEKK